jgi:flagellar hook-associated protein 2
MAELLSTSTNGTSAMDALAESYKNSQQPRINDMTAKRSVLQSRNSFYSTFKSRIDGLVTQIDKFTASSAKDKFLAKAVTSSDSTIVSATAGGSALIGSNSIKVDRLAKNDVLISNRTSLTGAFGEAAGISTFDLSIGETTKQISVTFDGTETNEQAMKKIVTAINRTTDFEVNASFVKDTKSTGRITLNSKKTGADNKISFSQNSALTKLGLDPTTLFSNTSARLVSTDTTAGYREADYSNLDSKFELNGINITRGTNSVKDALDGVTINLLKTQKTEDKAIDITTTVNSASVQSFVKGLLTGINDIISNISNNKDVRKNDTAMSGLLQSFRNVALNKFGDGSADSPQYLVDLGIKFDSSGFLVISDTDLFKKKLEEDPLKVAEMFIGPEGLAKKLDKLVSPFKGKSGLISAKRKSLDSQIENASKRIADTEQKIDTQANALKKQYQSYLQLFYKAQSQSSYLAGFTTTTS